MDEGFGFPRRRFTKGERTKLQKVASDRLKELFREHLCRAIMDDEDWGNDGGEALIREFNRLSGYFGRASAARIFEKAWDEVSCGAIHSIQAAAYPLEKAQALPAYEPGDPKRPYWASVGYLVER